MPQVRRIDYSDLRVALRKGFDDFTACRSDVAFLCLLYPIIGITLAWLAFQGDLLALLFPVVSGFALVGPVAGVGLYELSRRREMGKETELGRRLRGGRLAVLRRNPVARADAGHGVRRLDHRRQRHLCRDDGPRDA